MGRKNSAFTLIELMIVIVFLALMAILIMTYLNSPLLKGNDALRKSDLDRIKIAAEDYEKDHNCFPPPNLMTCDPGTGLTPYLNKIPCEPKSKTSYFYTYDNGICPKWFKIYVKLQNASDPAAIPGIGPGGSFNYVVSSSNAPLDVSGQGPGTDGYFGCISGSCQPVSWDPSIPGLSCNPTYQDSNCFGYCNVPSPIPCTSRK